MGFKEVVDWKKRMDDNKAKFADGGDYTPFFSLKDGEVVEGLWFNGTEEDDPLIIEVHTINMTEKGRKSFVTVVHNPEECLACFLQGRR